MMDQNRIDRTYRKWIISLLAVIFLLVLVSLCCIIALTLMLAQVRKDDPDFLTRKTRDIDQRIDVQTGDIVEIFKKDIQQDYTCVLNAHDEDKSNDQPVCITNDCTQTAATLIASMDRSVDPCEDFFQFACGGFIRKNPVPNDAKFTSTSLLNYKFYLLILRNLLEDAHNFKEPQIVFKMQEAYHVCINTTYQPEKEAKAFKRILQDQFYDWPLMDDDAQKINLTLEEFMGILIRNGFKVPFIDVSIEANTYDDSKEFIPYIGKHESEPPTDLDALRPEECEDGVGGGSVEQLARYIKPNNTDVCYRNKMMAAQLSIGSILLSLGGGEEYQKMTISQLTKETENQLNWLQLLNTVFHGVHVFKETDEIITKDQYLKLVLEGMKLLSKNDIIRYILNVIVQDLALNGGPEIDRFYLDIVRKDNPTFNVDREDTCLMWIIETYPMVLTRLVVKRFLPSKTKEQATKMIELIIKAYEENIRNSDWVDEVTKERAINKARSMQKQIAYPEFVLHDDVIEEEHKMIPIYSTHIENYVALKNYHGSEKFHQFIKKFRPESDWLATPLTINAGYSPEMNTVVMQLGMLTLPYFDPNRVAAVNYGMVGSVIGHEIGHGFDTTGRLYNSKGKKIQWWTEETETKYEALTECFINQYSGYCPEELGDYCVDGNQTVGENMADNTGLRAAFEAYKMLVKEIGEEKRLPGLQEYTPEQIFFIGFGYAWCENMPPENFKERYGNDEHSPARFRVLGALSNSKEFADTFKCSPGKMNRGENSCTLW